MILPQSVGDAKVGTFVIINAKSAHETVHKFATGFSRNNWKFCQFILLGYLTELP